VAPSGGIAVGQGAYDLHLHFDVPRAQLVEWTVTCPGADSQGGVGEAFESYRARRLAQLKADREREKQTAGALTSLVVGAVAPSVHAQAQSGPAQASADVSGQAVGDAAGAAVANSIDTNVELPPGDVGAGRLETVVHVVTTAPGTCVVTAVADDPNVAARFELVHIRDLEAERHTRDVAIDSADVQARTQLATQLTAFGGDASLRIKQREAAEQARATAEAQAGAAASLRVRASLELQHQQAAAAISIEESRTQIAFAARSRYRALLISWGADANYRARIQAQATELEMRRLRIAIDVRARYRALLILWGADINYRAHLEARLQAERDAGAVIASSALPSGAAPPNGGAESIDAELQRQRATELDVVMRARIQMRAYLVAMGARERPPMPALIAENPGARPFDGASWIAGHWTWSGVEWGWNPGGWTDRSVSFGASGGEQPVAPPVVVETPVVVGPPPTMTVSVPVPTIVIHDHRTQPVHRSPPPENKTKPIVHDHR
jgi:hypothetical protein